MIFGRVGFDILKIVLCALHVDDLSVEGAQKLYSQNPSRAKL